MDTVQDNLPITHQAEDVYDIVVIIIFSPAKTQTNLQESVFGHIIQAVPTLAAELYRKWQVSQTDLNRIRLNPQRLNTVTISSQQIIFS